jgi:hypothetical protein
LYYTHEDFQTSWRTIHSNFYRRFLVPDFPLLKLYPLIGINP